MIEYSRDKWSRTELLGTMHMCIRSKHALMDWPREIQRAELGEQVSGQVDFALDQQLLYSIQPCPLE